MALSTDKRVSARALDGLVDALDKARSHIPVRPEEVPPLVRGAFFKAFREAGHSGAQAESGNKLLTEHIENWHASLVAKGNTEKHADLVTGRTRRAFEGAGFTYWGDIAASRLERWLAERRRAGVSVQTSNHVLQACRQLRRWMVDNGRAESNPLAGMKPLNVKLDRRHDRRAFEPDELRQLLDVTRRGPDRLEMAGSDRATAYRLSAETGLRAGELRSLTPTSFHLAGPEPMVTVAAAYSKRRREDSLPLRQDTARNLRAFLAGRPPDAPVFNLPPKDKVVKMLRADLAAAREAWIQRAATPAERQERERSSFLAYRDASGRVLDFHALRHTFITNLARADVHPKEAQELARHSTITLTMDRYTHTARGTLAAAVESIPSLTDDGPETRRMKATGTDDPSARLPLSLPDSGPGQCRSMPLSAVAPQAADASDAVQEPP